MANHCFTEITIAHPDCKELEALQMKILAWAKENYGNNAYGENWLGNIVGNSGIDPNAHVEVKTINGRESSVPVFSFCCSGDLYSCKVLPQRDELVITTSTVWEPVLRMWQAIIDKHLPGAQLFYTAKESGCDLFCSNDPDYEGCYYLDSFDCPEITSDYCMKEDALVAVMRESLRRNSGTVEELLPDFRDTFGDGLNVHKWEYAPESDWE